MNWLLVIGNFAFCVTLIIILLIGAKIYDKKLDEIFNPLYELMNKIEE